jgi:hypothetical protein
MGEGCTKNNGVARGGRTELSEGSEEDEPEVEVVDGSPQLSFSREKHMNVPVGIIQFNSIKV